MKRELTFATSALAAVLVAAAASSIERVPQPVRFCDSCVQQHNSVEWRLARWKLFDMSEARPTPISELLEQHQLLSAHQHAWSTPRLVAESELETPDAPRVRSIGLLNTPRVVNFLNSVFSYTDSTSVASWRMVAWEPDLASALDSALRFARFPQDGFESRAEFLAWWNENAFPLFNRLHEITEPD